MKYKIKNKYLKFNSHMRTFNQKGGQLIKGDVDLSSADLSDRIITLLEGTTKDVRNPDLLGEGANGIVYLLTDNSVIKILNDIPKFILEKNNNIVVNVLSSINPFFPKYYSMFQHNINLDGDKKERGIIVSERLLPIYIIFNSATSNFMSADTNLHEAFYKQFYFLFYSILDFYQKTGNILIPNDTKIDNILLKKIATPLDYIPFTLANGSTINIPLIISGTDKYHLVFNDFGESYTFNNQTKQENYDKNSTFNFKYFDFRDDGDVNAVKAIVRSLSFIEQDFSYLKMASATPIDKLVASDSKRERIFSSLRRNIMNINAKIL
jgi:hypothetical protein